MDQLLKALWPLLREQGVKLLIVQLTLLAARNNVKVDPQVIEGLARFILKMVDEAIENANPEQLALFGKVIEAWFNRQGK